MPINAAKRDSTYLEVKEAMGLRKVPLEAGPLTIGRNPTNLLSIEEPMASRFHCVIEQTPEGFVLRDLQSRNGTKLNGQPVTSARLNVGDAITIGATEMRLVGTMPAGTAPSASPAARPATGGASTASGNGPAARPAVGGPAAGGPTGGSPAPFVRHHIRQIKKTATGAVPVPIGPPPPPEEPESDPEPDLSVFSDPVVKGAEPVRAKPSVPEAFERYEKEVPAASFANAFEWERHLRERAELLGNKTITEDQIVLVNARGVASGSGKGAGKAAGGGEAVTAMKLILLICFRSRATDIHLEPKQEDVQARIRVDGTMVELARLPKELGIRLSSMVKVLCDIDISQKNSVQEGAFSARVPNSQAGLGERRVDYRVSFAPAVYGQKLVIRVLDAASAPLTIGELNYGEQIESIVRRAVEQESGMVLVCGPTGSGKTTTLYAVLRDIDVNERNVVTIEDPVEIQLEGVTQIPVNDAQENTFANLLRSVLRQDPDVILVGEVRDGETARTAIQAAMTGHLVFSTVHSRDTVGALYRLLDLGIEPYLVSAGLQLLLGQRLVRKLCTLCRKPVRPTPHQLQTMAQYGFNDVKQIFNPRGCARCLGTGYKGRRGIIELLSFTPQLREIIRNSPTIQEIQQALGPENYIRLGDSGYQLVAEGVSSFDEIEKAVS